jgi:hypothetical protein
MPSKLFVLAIAYSVPLFDVFHLPLEVFHIFGELVDHPKCDQSKCEADNSECLHISVRFV